MLTSQLGFSEETSLQYLPRLSLATDGVFWDGWDSQIVPMFGDMNSD